MPEIRFSNQYPYTDFHELNLDWVIKEVKYWSTKVGKTIQSIELSGTAGLVDTYTINYSDGSTSTFDVTNGNGIASVAKTGTAGLVDTYTITFQDGTSTTFEVHNGTASIDSTLTLSGYAADAAATGEALREIGSQLPTYGDDQLINPLTVTVINARVTTNNPRLIADDNYRAIIVPVTVAANEHYRSEIFDPDVSVAEFYLATFNSVNFEDPCVEKSSNRNLDTTQSANYIVIVLRLVAGTIEEVKDSIVLRKSLDTPTAYVPYFKPVDIAISEAVGDIETQIGTVEQRVDELTGMMPTNGDQQLLDPLSVITMNARITTSDQKIIEDNNYRAIIVPTSIEIGDTFYARMFSPDVSVNTIRLFTLNSIAVGSPIVDAPYIYSDVTKSSAVTATGTASYLFFELHITSGTVESAIDSAVFAKSSVMPDVYVPYYISVDDAIGKVNSPDCIEVGTDTAYPYTDINAAAVANPGSIIKINYGTYETEVENLATDKTLVGTDKDLCVLTGTDRDYDTPPIEIAGGIIKNVSVKMYNDPDAVQKGYCVHSDGNNAANNTLIVRNCYFECSGQHTIGLGVWNGEQIIFDSCEFYFIDNENPAVHAAFFAHNAGDESSPATISFRNCIFRAKSGYALKLQEWPGGCVLNFEFIDCNCYSETYGTTDSCIWTDYNTGTPHDPDKLHMFDGVEMILLPTSHGNNISVLNANQ